MSERFTISIDHHEFKIKDWVHFGGSKQNVAEVVDTKGEQIKLRCITPNKGKVLYTTFSTSFTMPIDKEEKERIQGLLLKQEKAATANVDYGSYIQPKDSEFVDEEFHHVNEQDEQEHFENVQENKEEELVLSEPGEDVQLSLF